MNRSSPWTAVGAASAALGVALGAAGAHALRTVLDADALATWHTAVEYQLWHSLALVTYGVLVRDRPTIGVLRIVGPAFSCGILAFSGSLYLLAVTGIAAFGWLTPLGGVALIVGWVSLALGSLRT